MSADVKAYVQSCRICQRHKHPKGRTPGLLHPIPVSRIFEQVHIDIVGPINAAAISGARYIITAIDAYTRYGYAKSVSQAKTEDCLDLLEEIIFQHGVPEKLVSDQGAQFTSAKWQKKCEDYGIKHHFTTPYHPNSNGMDERFNSSLVKILRSYAHQLQSRWDEHLRKALFIYNTSHQVQESIGFSPYEVMFGFKPRTPLNLRPVNPMPIAQSRTHIRKEVYFNDKQAKEQQKLYHDRRRSVPTFYIGQPVLLRQHCIEPHQVSKLSLKWDGPGIVLRLPSSSDD